MRMEVIRSGPTYATPTILRARGLHVLVLGPWMVLCTPRGHWSNHL